MKKLRYNDKLWFGKYNGVRACDIIGADSSYLHKLMAEHKITLDERLMEKLNKRKSSIFGMDFNPRRQEPTEPFVETGANGIQQNIVREERGYVNVTFPFYDEQENDQVTQTGNVALNRVIENIGGIDDGIAAIGRDIDREIARRLRLMAEQQMGVVMADQQMGIDAEAALTENLEREVLATRVQFFTAATTPSTMSFIITPPDESLS